MAVLLVGTSSVVSLSCTSCVFCPVFQVSKIEVDIISHVAGFFLRMKEVSPSSLF